MALKDMPWGADNPCYGCGAKCCKLTGLSIPMTKDEKDRLFPELDFIPATITADGSGAIRVDGCPHLVDNRCDIPRDERPEACKKWPIAPNEVPAFCNFPKGNTSWAKLMEREYLDFMQR